ncbi:MAG TPA: AAA family ATPase, partial [Clostridiales bacterium]|nr:AAA family ATPase [Clostridiales bacterium]
NHMVLKTLEMQGFKSFPDKTVLRFDRGMTAVVGPNGSGKSNISDAVRWVLGEQSTKTLRGAKMEDVIFSGTDSRRALGYAEVTLRLDNTDRALKKDTDEVAVTRRYYRSGESEYKLNGESARLKDINELFMDTGLGRDGYSIVSQGKVADMVSAKSNQRRDMLEEAAGISHFRYRRTDALRRLSQAEDNLVRLRDILAELESRVGPLKNQSEKVQKFLVLSEEKKQQEISLWLYNIDHLKEKLKEQEHKVDLASHQYHEAEAKLTQIEEQIERALERSRALTLQIEEIRNAAKSQEERAAEISSDIAVDENTIALNQQSMERIRRDMEAAATERDQTEETVLALQKAVEDLKQQEKAKQEAQQSILDKAEALGKESATHSEQSAVLSKKLQQETERIAEARLKKTSAEAGLLELTSRKEEEDTTEKERQQLAEELEKSRAEAKKRTESAEEAVTTLSNAIQGYTMRAETRSLRAEERKNEAERLRREVQKREDRVRLLEDMEKNMEGYQGSVKAVAREAKRGTLHGIHGPLSQLISVPDAYALAVETALGAAIQNIVVDREEDAKRAIAFLKESNSGRATFLPISAIRSRSLQEPGLEDCFGYVNLASNLVKTDERYREIVQSQLGRTVVAEDM